MKYSSRWLLLAIAFSLLVLFSASLAGCYLRPSRIPNISPPGLPTTPSSQPTMPSVLPAETPPVPPEYQALFNELGSELTHFEGVLNQKWDGSRGQTIWATELAYANGNAGEWLLGPDATPDNLLLLDRLQAIGVKGVVVAVKFPLLKPDYPRSSEYLRFFKDIVAECHRRGLKVLVESGAVFAGTPYSPIQYSWSRYTTASFLKDLQDELIVIAREIKPDYLTLANEPQTEESLTGLVITPTQWKNFIADTIGKIDRSGGILLGAGSGTWENPDYINTIIGMRGLDYIDLHIYPLNKDGKLFERGLDYAMQARAAGQRVTISESWLWKASAQELGNGLGDSEKAMNRDVYSFWYPLDERFIGDIMDLADATKMDFISFFWMRNFFAYLDYDSTPPYLSTLRYNQLMNQAGLVGVQNGTLSPTAQYFQQQISSRAAR
jgi:hypothetical protein